MSNIMILAILRPLEESINYDAQQRTARKKHLNFYKVLIPTLYINPFVIDLRDGKQSLITKTNGVPREKTRIYRPKVWFCGRLYAVLKNSAREVFPMHAHAHAKENATQRRPLELI